MQSNFISANSAKTGKLDKLIGPLALLMGPVNSALSVSPSVCLSFCNVFFFWIGSLLYTDFLHEVRVVQQKKVMKCFSGKMG